MFNTISSFTGKNRTERDQCLYWHSSVSLCDKSDVRMFCIVFFNIERHSEILKSKFMWKTAEFCNSIYSRGVCVRERTGGGGAGF